MTETSKNLGDEKPLEKNRRIKESGILTRERRKSMDVKVRDVKIVDSSLNKAQKEALNRLFLEYKWLRNSALGAQRFDLGYLKEVGNTVQITTQNGVEDREIKYLGSQMKQQVITELSRNLKSLSALKKNGKNVGKLKFVSEVRSIDLQQFGVTYQLYANSKSDYTKIRVQNVPGKLRIRGFEQLRVDGIEFANAKLVKMADGFHLMITTFVPKETKESANNEKSKPTSTMGIDFGVRTSFTFDDGTKINAIVEESERLKRLQRKLQRQQKGSNGYYRTLSKIRKEYLKIDYKKNELARKLVHSWCADNTTVFFQDENISGWKNKKSIARGGRKIHHGVLGRVKTLLKNRENTVMLPSWVATTQWCLCGTRTKHHPSKKMFVCSGCGFTEDRDTHAANNMVILGKRYAKLTSGTEGIAGGTAFDVKQLYAAEHRVAMKPETSRVLDTP